MKKAFTLIELLIVIAIIGTLVAVAVVKFADLASDRNLRVCQANLRTLASAIAVYRVQEKAWPSPDIYVVATSGYVLEIPECPGGGKYLLDVDHADCDFSGTPSHVLPKQTKP